MIALNILYPAKEGAYFDSGYYFDRHMPSMVQKLRNSLRGMTLAQGVNRGRAHSRPHYFAVCELLFDSTDAAQAVFAAHDEALGEDVHKYTDVKPVMQISEVKARS